TAPPKVSSTSGRVGAIFAQTGCTMQCAMRMLTVGTFYAAVGTMSCHAAGPCDGTWRGQIPAGADCAYAIATIVVTNGYAVAGGYTNFQPATGSTVSPDGHPTLLIGRNGRRADITFANGHFEL